MGWPRLDGDASAGMEVTVADVTRFAGFRSPTMLLTDGSLSRADKLGGLSTWQMLLLRQQMDGDDERRGELVREIETALLRLAGNGRR